MHGLHSALNCGSLNMHVWNKTCWPQLNYTMWHMYRKQVQVYHNFPLHGMQCQTAINLLSIDNF